MIDNLYPSYLYNNISKHSIFLIILCFSLISCSIPKKNSQNKIKQAQSEQKPLIDHEKKLPLSTQQKTNSDNYFSEIKSTQTSEEKSAQLEEKLDSSLRDFDEMLLKKNEALSEANRQEKSQGGNGLASQEQGEAESSQNGTNGDPSTASGASGQVNTGTISQNSEYDNDDIVARQIREAAEKETDPELKKKLWEEYRKYKTGNN